MKSKEVGELQNYLNSVVLERKKLIDYCIAAVLSGNHIFMLGPPGVAKTLLAEEISQCFNVPLFTKLLSKETKPEEIFGPIKISGLKLDIYERNIQNYLPTAVIAVLDEVWKSGIILNSLLTILNERKYDNGNTRITTPLRSAFFASNELPEDSSLNALYDRMLFRVQVDYISEEDNFVALMNKGLNRAVVSRPTIDINQMIIKYELEIKTNPKFSFEDPNGTKDEEKYRLLYRFHDFVRKCRRNNIAISDRRAKAILEGIRAYYYVLDRKIDENMFYDMADMIWYSPEERVKIIQLACDPADPFVPQATTKVIDHEEALNRILLQLRERKIIAMEARNQIGVLLDKCKSDFNSGVDNNHITQDLVDKIKKAQRQVLLAV